MEFTKSFLKHMEILRKANKFYDLDLKQRVNDAMYDLSDNATDEQLDLWSAIMDSEDDEEFWNCYHALALLLNI